MRIDVRQWFSNLFLPDAMYLLPSIWFIVHKLKYRTQISLFSQIEFRNIYFLRNFVPQACYKQMKLLFIDSSYKIFAHAKMRISLCHFENHWFTYTSPRDSICLHAARVKRKTLSAAVWASVCAATPISRGEDISGMNKPWRINVLGEFVESRRRISPPDPLDLLIKSRDTVPDVRGMIRRLGVDFRRGEITPIQLRAERKKLYIYIRTAFQKRQ